jgi:hypothetical protein
MRFCTSPTAGAGATAPLGAERAPTARVLADAAPEAPNTLTTAVLDVALVTETGTTTAAIAIDATTIVSFVFDQARENVFTV